MEAEKDFHRPILHCLVQNRVGNDSTKPAQANDDIADNAQQHPDAIADAGESLDQA